MGFNQDAADEAGAAFVLQSSGLLDAAALRVIARQGHHVAVGEVSDEDKRLRRSPVMTITFPEPLWEVTLDVPARGGRSHFDLMPENDRARTALEAYARAKSLEHLTVPPYGGWGKEPTGWQHFVNWLRAVVNCFRRVPNGRSTSAAPASGGDNSA